MAEENSNPNVEDIGKVPPDVPPATQDILERSNKHMSMLAKNFINDAERNPSTAGRPDKEIPKAPSQSSAPKRAEDKVGADQPKAPEKEVKPDEQRNSLLMILRKNAELNKLGLIKQKLISQRNVRVQLLGRLNVLNY